MRSPGPRLFFCAQRSAPIVTFSSWLSSFSATCHSDVKFPEGRTGQSTCADQIKEFPTGKPKAPSGRGSLAARISLVLHDSKNHRCRSEAEPTDNIVPGHGNERATPNHQSQTTHLCHQTQSPAYIGSPILHSYNMSPFDVKSLFIGASEFGESG
ncbi:hypothetical protein STEG23_035803 [Scotinomys teguina]